MARLVKHPMVWAIVAVVLYVVTGLVFGIGDTLGLGNVP